MTVLDKTELQTKQTVHYLRHAVKNGYRFYTTDKADKRSPVNKVVFNPLDLYSDKAFDIAKFFWDLERKGKIIHIIKPNGDEKKLVFSNHE